MVLLNILAHVLSLSWSWTLFIRQFDTITSAVVYLLTTLFTMIYSSPHTEFLETWLCASERGWLITFYSTSGEVPLYEVMLQSSSEYLKCSWFKYQLYRWKDIFEKCIPGEWRPDIVIIMTGL
jgi:hypothetical protein